MNKLILYDINLDLCKAWKDAFKGVENVEIQHIPFSEVKCRSVVTAGNSYGWMTGGIDLAVRDYYGINIQDKVQEDIIYYHAGCLPVGMSVVVKTEDDNKPNLIYAPTMEVPSKINPIDVYYVFFNILNRYYKITDIACCGLGTLTGGITPEQCAKEMRRAYDYYISEVGGNSERT